MLSSTVDFAGSRITRRQISGDSCEGFSRLDWSVGIPLSTLTKVGRPALNLNSTFFMTPHIRRSLASLPWHLTYSQVHLFCLYHCCCCLCHSSLTSELNFFGPPMWTEDQCGSSGILQAFGTRWGLLRHPAPWTKPLLVLGYSSVKRTTDGLSGCIMFVDIINPLLIILFKIYINSIGSVHWENPDKIHKVFTSSNGSMYPVLAVSFTPD